MRRELPPMWKRRSSACGMSAEAHQLDATLADLADAIRDAQTFQHQHGLASAQTRKLPADMLRILRRWRSENSGVMTDCPEPRPLRGAPAEKRRPAEAGLL